MLTSLSWVCWVFPNSVIAHQLGSGLNGLGLGVVGFDWSSICSYLGTPLASPWFSTANIAAGFSIFMYLIVPTAYTLNLYHARRFPIFSDGLFSSDDQKYNISAITDSNFHLDLEAYQRQGPLYLSTMFAMSYGIGFACLSATLVHVLLFHGSDILQLSKSVFQGKKIDIHTKIMRKNYKQVTEWWFLCILLFSITAATFVCEYYNDQLQLPWWGVMLACVVAVSFTLPVGIIRATTNQAPALNVITEYIIGYIYPGYPIAVMLFKVYGNMSMKQAIFFLQYFKLGHYMKIPPKSNVLGTGPRRIFGNLGHYSAINWFFLAGAIAPLVVWLAHKAFPDKPWIKLITMPVLLGALSEMPPATPSY
ncbi:hypothetical protein RYX36_027813 [Vicia faba]